MSGAREIGSQPRQKTGRHAGERERLIRPEHALERLGHRST
jgi:hypothetical protein